MLEGWNEVILGQLSGYPLLENTIRQPYGTRIVNFLAFFRKISTILPKPLYIKVWILNGHYVNSIYPAQYSVFFFQLFKIC